jgi:pyruvate,orthophosphate dikinase
MVPEIMIPLVGEVKELKFVKDMVAATADRLIAASGLEMRYEVGTMIEIPRAALTADEIAREAEFFSFGTNDLTQMTFGFSRDDAGKFLGYYYASWWIWLSSWVRPPAPTSIWGSAVSTAATPPRWSSSTRPACITYPAPPTGCPSPGWPPPRLPSSSPGKRKTCPRSKRAPEQSGARLLR